LEEGALMLAIEHNPDIEPRVLVIQDKLKDLKFVLNAAKKKM